MTFGPPARNTKSPSNNSLGLAGGRVGSVSLLAECSWSDQDRRSSALFSVQGTACSRQVK